MMIFGKVTTQLYFVSSIKQVRDYFPQKNLHLLYSTIRDIYTFKADHIPKEISVEVSDEKHNE